MNPFTAMKAKKTLEENHPKAALFVKQVIMSGMPADSVIEISVTKPGESTKTTNVKITQSDLDALNELLKMAK